MNYYEHHIGDYSEATQHLTFVEDAAYSRLLRKYYSTESPLPADIKQVQRLVGARTREEKISVETVLREFFSLEDDGWHNERCDAELEKFRSGEPERELRKTNETNRLKRHREERANLFKVITDAGLHADWNIGMKALREMANRVTGNSPETPTQPLHETAPATPETETATAPATPATATQTPIPNTQTPVVNPLTTTPPPESGKATAARAAIEPKANARAILSEAGVSDQVANDWIAMRNKKRAAVTKTAIDGIEAEARKANISLEDALRTCCANGWQGFKAEWIANKPGIAAAATKDESRERASQFLTGRSHDGSPSNNERDITSEVQRVA